MTSKRTAALILAALTALAALSGCGSSDGGEEAGGISLGSTEGGFYSSEYSGLKIELPEGWSFADEAAFAASLGVEPPLNGGAASSEELSGLAVIYDAMMTGGDEESLTIMYENLAKTENSADVDEEMYMDNVAAYLSSPDGCGCEVGEYRTENICGEDYLAAEALMSGGDRGFLYCVRRIDDFMLCIIYTGYPGKAEITGG